MKTQMDRARTKTDKKLNQMEREIGRIYENDPALLRALSKYQRYMQSVEDNTKDLYEEYINADDDHKDEAKKAYTDRVKQLTQGNKTYRSIVNAFVRTLATVNQKAVDVANNSMTEVYAINYNQVAVDCKKVGIKVDG